MNIPLSLPISNPEELRKGRAWAKQFFSRASDLPISFVLDRKTICGIPTDWRPVSHKRIIDSSISETVFDGNDSSTGLNVRVECIEYRDFPVIEWVAWFTNQGDVPTPVIQDILAMDGTITGSSPVLYHCNGDFCSEDGYTSHETPLLPGNTLDFSPNGGRPCDGAFPYYRVMFAGWGLSIAIGWPAQWSASFSGRSDGVHVRAGQEITRLRLMPGETIRTPRMTVMFWSGDVSRAVNLWRRWYRAHILPRPNGLPIQPLLACAGTDEGEEFTAATEENQIRFIEKFNQHGICPDVWWIDAGWYPCYNKDHQRKWPITGTWIPDPERFPNGLKPVSDCAARRDADLLVWFEPERVAPDTQLDVQHPQWLLKSKPTDQTLSSWLRTHSGDSSLLNLGIPECRQWLTDHVCRLIADNGIKIYRQDHNFAPLAYWRNNEAPDRAGLNENLYVQGYLQFWDDLLARNPGLWIDSCASGGRRNDLETMRRSVPLHYTDFGYGNHPVKLAFHHTMYEWIPYFKEFTLSWDLSGNKRFDTQIDSFSFHCGMAPMLFASLDIRRDDYDYPLACKMIAVWRRAANLLLFGDYYPHTPFLRSDDEWVAWQFDSPESCCGLVQAIRLPASPDQSLTIHLKGICPQTLYVFENAESGEIMNVAGNDLIRDGFTFALPARSGAIWFYRTPVSPLSPLPCIQ